MHGSAVTVAYLHQSSVAPYIDEAAGCKVPLCLGTGERAENGSIDRMDPATSHHEQQWLRVVSREGAYARHRQRQNRHREPRSNTPDQPFRPRLAGQQSVCQVGERSGKTRVTSIKGVVMPSRQGLLITAGVCPLCIAEPSISAMSMLGISMRRRRIAYHRHDESGHETARNGAFRVCLSHLIFSFLKQSCDNDNSSPLFLEDSF